MKVKIGIVKTMPNVICGPKEVDMVRNLLVVIPAILFWVLLGTIIIWPWVIGGLIGLVVGLILTLTVAKGGVK